MWEGECFVFDERVTINDRLEKGSYTQCFACRSPLTSNQTKSKFFEAGISCPKCVKETTVKQKKKDTKKDKNKYLWQNKRVLSI